MDIGYDSIADETTVDNGVLDERIDIATPDNDFFFRPLPRWTAHPYILYQVCGSQGACCCVVIVLVVEAWRLDLTRRMP